MNKSLGGGIPRARGGVQSRGEDLKESFGSIYFSVAGQFRTTENGRLRVSREALKRKRCPSSDTAHRRPTIPLRSTGRLNNVFGMPGSNRAPVEMGTAATSSVRDLKKSSRPSARHATLSAPPLEICHFPPPSGTVCT